MKSWKTPAPKIIYRKKSLMVNRMKDINNKKENVEKNKDIRGEKEAEKC